MNILVSLTKGYGLGDAVQMSAVLRHVRKYRPHWEVHFQAEKGRESVGLDIAHRVFAYNEGPPTHYDAEIGIVLYDTFANWPDRPNTRVVSCLREKFGIEWDPACARYWISVPREVGYAVQAAMAKWSSGRQSLSTRCVALHYQGDSAPDKKDLSDAQAQRIVELIRALGRYPLLLDWRGKNDRLKGAGRVVDPAHGGDAAWNCAVISQCEAFVGIDSGPAKCASATETPSLVVWTGHHPALFHDPAPNTTHLVPEGYSDNYPGVRDFFEREYNFRRYTADPVQEVEAWLKATLR